MTIETMTKLGKENIRLSRIMEDHNQLMRECAKAIHYPECWDVAAYPAIEDALKEVAWAHRCTSDECCNK